MNKAQKRFGYLLSLFDTAAQDWGWESDQGHGPSVEETKLKYEKAKKHLTDYINKKLGE